MPCGTLRLRVSRWRRIECASGWPAGIFPGLPLRVARRTLRHLHRLKSLAPPRLSAAVLSTAWNRWCTERRFGRHGPCVLQCGVQQGEDSVEHYALCPIVRGFAASFLRLDFPGARGLEVLTLSAPELDCDVTLVRAAILAYATWRHTEATRRAGSVPRPHRFHDHGLQQAAREAVKGHPRASGVLDGGFDTTRLVL